MPLPFLSAAYNARAAERAAEASAEGTRAGIDETRRQFDTVVGLQRPAIESRDAALAALTPLLYGSGSEATDALRDTPGYQFLADQGERGVLAARNAAGDIYGGGTAVELQRRRMGLADNTYNNRVAQLMAAAGLGSAGANAVSGAALQTGANNAALLQREGDARASGILGRANSINGSLENLVTLMTLGVGG